MISMVLISMAAAPRLAEQSPKLIYKFAARSSSNKNRSRGRSFGNNIRRTLTEQSDQVFDN